MQLSERLFCCAFTASERTREIVSTEKCLKNIGSREVLTLYSLKRFSYKKRIECQSLEYETHMDQTSGCATSSDSQSDINTCSLFCQLFSCHTMPKTTKRPSKPTQQGITFNKDLGQHILKNPLIISNMIEKVSCRESVKFQFISTCVSLTGITASQ